MAGQWYCQLGAQQYGPVDFATFQSWAREGRIAADDLVWTEGMANWQPAKTIPNLFADAPAGATQNSGGAPQMPPFVPQPMSPPYGYQMQTWSLPHHGVVILVLGLVGLFTAWLFCIGLIPSIIALVLAQHDAAKVKAGLMDPSGRGMAVAGKVLAIIAVVLGIALVLGGVVGFKVHDPN